LYENEEGQVSHSCASDIEFDYENRPWFATSRFAKYLVNNNWIEVPHAPDIAGFSDVNCVEMDKKDEIWLGTETEGLVSYYNSKLAYYSTKNSDIPSNRIASLAVDSLNNLWLGTKDSRIA
ncbi:MAG: two-component regulator propeller domain-containing protein, partial [Candidatus Kapaibacterium sp.]